MSEKLLQEHGIKDTSVAIIKALIKASSLSLNPMQLEFLKNGFLDKDRVIVSAPTASGKTLVAYLKYARNVESGKNRMVYLLPYLRMRRELLEKLREWNKLGITSTDEFAKYEEGKAQILVSTYSSVDFLLLQGKKLDSDFFIFDEIDMINDDLQGTKTEAVISRILRESKIPALYAISATIGSPEIVEKWLSCMTFSSDFRPGDFQRIVKEFSSEKEQCEIIEEIFQSQINEKKPMLVFYYNTDRCRKTALKLAKLREKSGKRNHNQDITEGSKQIVSQCDMTGEINDQLTCVRSGVAFYFARLQPPCKEVIETLLERNALDVVFTTPALARGINMPVRTVVIPHPFKYSKTSGSVPISRVEIEQMMGRACRPPFQEKGFGILVSTNSARTAQLNETIGAKLEPMSSKFLQTAPRKGRTLNRTMLALEIIKEARMRNHSEDDLMKMFDSYLFTQQVTDREGLRVALKALMQILMKHGLLEKNVDEEIVTPELVDIVIDNGVDDLNRMLCVINLSKSIVENKLNILSGQVLGVILNELCRNYSSYVGIVKDKYDDKKVQTYLAQETKMEPEKVDSEQKLLAAILLYSSGTPLERIEKEFGLEPDSIPYTCQTVYQDLNLLAKLVRKQCMGDHDKVNFCNFVEMSANSIKRGLPCQVLPFVELIERLGRKTALRILYRYGSAREILRVLSDEKRTEKEFKEIEGIGKIMGQRIIDERKGLIVNLQTKITLSGTYTFS
jgi:replicative superfamily II helicase